MGTKPSKTKSARKRPGTFKPGELLSLPDFQTAAGVGDAGFRAMKKLGLPVRRIGNVRWILADDFIAMVEAIAPDKY